MNALVAGVMVVIGEESVDVCQNNIAHVTVRCLPSLAQLCFS